MKQALVIAAVLTLSLGAASSTRDDIRRLEARVASLFDRVQHLESRQEELRDALDDLSVRLDALHRAAQTADLRTDVESLKRRVEILTSRLSEAPADSPGPGSAAPEPGLEVLQPDPEPAPTPDEALGIYRNGLEDCNRRRYDLAASQFRQFLEQAPEDSLAGNAQYWIGECLYGQERFEESLQAFRAVRENHAASAKVPAARLKIGFCLRALGRTAEARRELESLIADLPDSDEARRAKETLAGP